MLEAFMRMFGGFFVGAALARLALDGHGFHAISLLIAVVLLCYANYKEGQRSAL